MRIIVKFMSRERRAPTFKDMQNKPLIIPMEVGIQSEEEEILRDNSCIYQPDVNSNGVSKNGEIHREDSSEAIVYASRNTAKKAPRQSVDTSQLSILQLYIREVGSHPLLSREEEYDLASKWLRAKKHIEESSELYTDEERDAVNLEIHQGKIARNKMIECNQRLVINIANKHRGLGVGFTDLIQEGNMGLMTAMDRFDPELGNKFSTYAIWWIRHAVGRAIADQGRNIRLPVHMGEKIRKMKEAIDAVSQKSGNDATIPEIALELGIPEEKVEEIILFAQDTISLHLPAGNNSKGDELGDRIIDSQQEITTEMIEAEAMHNKLIQALSLLPPREQRILELRFGLVDGIEYTLEEVGDMYGLTKERIRQLQNNAMKQLKTHKIIKHLRDELDN